MYDYTHKPDVFNPNAFPVTPGDTLLLAAASWFSVARLCTPGAENVMFL